MEATANRIEPGRVIGEAFETYRDHAGALLGGALLVIGIAGVIEGLLSTSGSIILGFLGALVGLAAAFLYTGYVVKLVQDVRDGRRDFSVGELFSHAAPYLGTLALAGILAGIAIAIGFVLIIVPGLILLTIWSVVIPVVMLEGAGVFRSFGRSQELVRGHAWNVFAVVAISVALILVAGILLGLVFQPIDPEWLESVAVNVTSNAIFAPFAAVAWTLMYFRLRELQAAP
jgi:hypothetical protein